MDMSNRFTEQMHGQFLWFKTSRLLLFKVFIGMFIRMSQKHINNS